MLKELLHVHFVHDIETILSLSHMENWLTHELVKNQNVVLLLEIVTERSDEERLEQRALGDK